MLEKIQETIKHIQQKIDFEPQIGIVLGTGLGGLTKEIETIATLPYKEIPNFPESTVKGHEGKLIFGKLGGKNVMAMQGRFHYYEGYTMQEVTFPIDQQPKMRHLSFLSDQKNYCNLLFAHLSRPHL